MWIKASERRRIVPQSAEISGNRKRGERQSAAGACPFPCQEPQWTGRVCAQPNPGVTNEQSASGAGRQLLNHSRIIALNRLRA